MKKSILVSSFLTIALCLSVLIGSTFALFTSEDKVNIAVTSGNVEVEATISELKTYSMDVEQAAGTFENGGVATLVNGELVLDKVTPGDKVTFTIAIDNKSNVNVKYRTLVYCVEDTGLFDGLSIKIGTETFTGFAYTPWTALVAKEDIADLAVSVELPKEAGNEYQNKSAKLLFVVEAVQGNGVEAGTQYLPVDDEGAYLISSKADLYIYASKVNSKEWANTTAKLISNIDLGNDAWQPIDTEASKAVVFDGQGYTISNLKVKDNVAAGLFGAATGSVIRNVVIDGAVVESNHYAGAIAGYGLCTKVENCTVKNSKITTSPEFLGTKWDNGDKAGAIVGYLSGQPTASVKNCTAENVEVKGYRDIGGIVGYAANGNCEVSGNTIKNSKVSCDYTHNYKNYADGAEFDVEAIIGEASSVVVNSNNVAENVTVEMPDLIVPGTTIGLTKNSVINQGGVIDLNSPEDFKYLSQLLTNWATITGTHGYDNYYYKWAWDIELNCDVDLANELWAPVDLNGLVFDGNNHVIKNLNVQAGDYAALFSKATNISNLHIENANIKGGNMTAVVAAHATGSYENITATNITVNGGKYVGGLFAKAYGNIVNCHVKGENNVIVATDKEVGGIVGFLTSGEGSNHTSANVVKDCSVANLQITGTEEVGGVIGRAYTYYETTITITATTSNVVVTATNAVHHGQILGRDYDGNGVTIN